MAISQALLALCIICYASYMVHMVMSLSGTQLISSDDTASSQKPYLTSDNACTCCSRAMYIFQVFLNLPLVLMSNVHLHISLNHTFHRV